MRSNHSILECHDLRKSFGDLIAVNGISFHITEGETYGLLGPNGAGKTTTISMICGLLERDGGEVLIDGVQLTPRSIAVKAGIGYVPPRARNLSGPHGYGESPFLRSTL